MRPRSGPEEAEAPTGAGPSGRSGYSAGIRRPGLRLNYVVLKATANSGVRLMICYDWREKWRHDKVKDAESLAGHLGEWVRRFNGSRAGDAYLLAVLGHDEVSNSHRFQLLSGDKELPMTTAIRGPRASILPVIGLPVLAGMGLAASPAWAQCLRSNRSLREAADLRAHAGRYCGSQTTRQKARSPGTGPGNRLGRANPRRGGLDGGTGHETTGHWQGNGLQDHQGTLKSCGRNCAVGVFCELQRHSWREAK